MIKYFEEKIKECNKNIFKQDELHIIKDQIKSDMLTKEEIDELIKKQIKNYIYKEHKNNEYNDNKNIDIIEIKKENNLLFVSADSKNGIVKINKPTYINDLEIATNKICDLMDIIFVDVKRIKYNNKLSLLYSFNNEFSYESFEKKSLNNEEEIIEYLENTINKSNVLDYLLFSILVDCKDVKLINNKHDKFIPIFNFSITKNSQEFINFNNIVVNINQLLDCLFKNYYDYISGFIFKNFSAYNYNKILEIYDLELEQKESEKIKNKFILNYNKLKELNEKKVKEIFESYSINSIDSLLEYMDKYFEYGTLIRMDDKLEKIPFGTLETTEGKNNKKITFDNSEIIATINKYYSKNKEKINPDNINITQLLKNISTLSEIIKNDYISNNPLDNLKYETGNSLEQMELISLYLTINKVEFKRYALSECIILENGSKKLIDTHFFIAAYINEKWNYIENSLYDFRGIFAYETLDDLTETVTSKIIYYREKNPYKDLPLEKYILNEINIIDSMQTYDKIISQISKSKKLDISNSIYMYNCENEIRKNILDGKTEAFIICENPILLKPDSNIKDQNEYKEEFIKLLTENIMNITYRDYNDGINFYNVYKKGKKELNQEKKEKEEKNTSTIALIIIILLIGLLIILKSILL